jgi:hypothetical protein
MLRFTTPLLAITFGFMVSSLSVSALAQHKVANDPFKYPVFEGNMACDDKVMVTVAHDRKIPNHFVLAIGKTHYKTIRLEDKAHGIVWLQMSNKSMLFNEKAGKRLANNCRNDAQKEVEVALQIQPDTSALGKP